MLKKQGGLLLKDFIPRSELILPEHRVERAKFPAIDAHTHYRSWGKGTARDVARAIEHMDACNVKALVALDANRTGSAATPLADIVHQLKGKRAGRFYVLATLPWEEEFARGGDFGKRLAVHVQRAYDEGADGIKIYKGLGLRHRDRRGRLVLPHDRRIAAVFAKCSELKLPVLYHIADPSAFFKPLSRFNERYEELQAHSAWHFHGRQFPSFQQLMESQEHLLEENPAVIFQSAHVASCAEDLAYVGALLDRYPNLYVDTAARLGELGRQPYTAREFFIRHADRVVFGTDHKPDPACYRLYFRCLETADEYFNYSVRPIPPQGRWMIYGLSLPAAVLAKIYHGNAERIYGSKPR